MNYIELYWRPTPMSADACDIAADALAGVGFDSFQTESDGLRAYCTEADFDRAAADAVLAALPLPGVSSTVTVDTVPVEDWNAAWEAEAARVPIVVGQECVVHAPTATDVPACHYDITIEPNMSFGTGHHDTTVGLIEEILKLRLDGLTVLDMGTGTGVLAILAAMHGARAVRAIEIDGRVAEGAARNVAANAMDGIVAVEQGDASSLRDTYTYDVIMANINLGILVRDMPAYVRSLAPDGVLLMSGFYEADVRALRHAARGLGLRFDYATTRGDWAIVRFVRELEVE